MTPRALGRLFLLPAALAVLLPSAAARAEDSKPVERGDALGQSRGRLGVQVLPMSPALREYFGVDEQTGVLVAEVEPESPADRAGIEAGDVLLEVDSQPTRSPREVIRRVDRAPEGEKLEITLSRRGKRKTLEVALRGEPRVSLRDYEERFRPWMDRTVDQFRKHLRELEQRLEELERRFEAGDQGTERT